MNRLGLDNVAARVKWGTVLVLGAGTVLGSADAVPHGDISSFKPPRVEKFTTNIQQIDSFSFQNFATEGVHWVNFDARLTPSFEDIEFLAALNITNPRPSGMAAGYVVQQQIAKALPVSSEDLWWLE